jgi:hypothetical protein
METVTERTGGEVVDTTSRVARANALEDEIEMLVRVMPKRASRCLRNLSTDRARFRPILMFLAEGTRESPDPISETLELPLARTC